MLPGDIGREKNRVHIEMSRMRDRQIYSDKKNCHDLRFVSIDSK